MSKIESFEMDIPQLNRSRTIWVYMPDNYEAVGEPLPVIYMHDGQNLFYDKLTKYGAAWHVDATLDKIFNATGMSAIVVGVECNDKRRLSEYSPWKITPLSAFRRKQKSDKCNRGGDGEKYAEFFAKTLKPTIDAKYNTDKERNATAVIGSSMGGLISCYLVLTYQRIYETMGLFSTAVFFNKTAFFRFIRKTPQTLPQHALIYCGGKEGLLGIPDKAMVRASRQLYQKLAKRGVECELLINSEFNHYETAWDVYFRKFAQDFLERYRQSKQK